MQLTNRLFANLLGMGGGFLGVKLLLVGLSPLCVCFVGLVIVAKVLPAEPSWVIRITVSVGKNLCVISIHWTGLDWTGMTSSHKKVIAIQAL